MRPNERVAPRAGTFYCVENRIVPRHNICKFDEVVANGNLAHLNFEVLKKYEDGGI